MEVLTVAIGGIIGVSGTGLGTWLQVRASGRQRREELRRLNWEAKREAYVALARAVDVVHSGAMGALVTGGGTVPRDVAQQLLGAAVVVELHAEPDVWARIKPAIDAVSLRANSVAVSAAASAAAVRLRELGAETTDGFERLRGQMLAAMRADLGGAAGHQR